MLVPGLGELGQASVWGKLVGTVCCSTSSDDPAQPAGAPPLYSASHISDTDMTDHGADGGLKAAGEAVPTTAVHCGDSCWGVLQRCCLKLIKRASWVCGCSWTGATWDDNPWPPGTQWGGKYTQS